VSTYLIRSFFLCVLSVSVLASELHQEPMPDSVLDYLVYSNHNAPYQYSDVESGHKGIVCQVVDAIAEEAGLEVHPHMEPIKRMKRSIRSDRYRHWITYGMRAWENQTDWDKHHFARTNIFRFQPVAVLPKDSSLQLQQLSDVGAVKVLLIHGFDYGATRSLLINGGAQIDEVDNQQKALSMLRQGRADLFIEDGLRIDFALREMELTKNDFRVVPIMPSSSRFDVTLVMSEDTPKEQITLMNDVLARMKNSGELEALVADSRLDSTL